MKSIPQVLFVNGFGGRDNAAPFHVSLNKFFKRFSLRFDLRSFAWDSLPPTPKVLVANFLQSQQAAKPAGQELCTLVNELENQGVLYHLIGFSLGAEVIRQALSHQHATLPNLRSIYLLAAAFNHNATINTDCIPPDARCNNYYSPRQDVVLSTSFYNVTGVAAAGSLGLSQDKRFANFATHCSHILAYDYTILAEALGFLLAWDDQQYIPGSIGPNILASTLGGEKHWNNICLHKGLLIQQNMHTKHYRAIENGGHHKRKAWGNNLHAIFRSI